MTKLPVSERRACRVIGQLRSTQRYVKRPNQFKEELKQRVITLATMFGRYGYRPITSILKMEGWDVGRDRVYTIWREEGLQIPQKQPKRARLWLADGSCIRKKPEYPNHVWSYDFVHCVTHDGKPFRILNVIDEYSRECLATLVKRKISSRDVIFQLAELFLERGLPAYIRSDNGPEFVAKKLLQWFNTLEVQPLFIEPGSPWENGYIESFNGKMRYEVLNGEIFYTLIEAKVIIEKWRRQYNILRPHSSLGNKPPVPQSVMPDLKALAL